MEVKRVGFKFLLRDPDRLSVRSLIPVFHSWIRKQAIPNHLLIDVHDYSHIYHGPGVLLVGHEGDVSLDLGQGQPGLFYLRKLRVPRPFCEIVKEVLKTCIDCCVQLEADGLDDMPLSFLTSPIRVVVYDRLRFPAGDESYAELSRILSGFLEPLFPDGGYRLQREGDSKEALTLRIELTPPPAAHQLAERLA